MAYLEVYPRYFARNIEESYKTPQIGYQISEPNMGPPEYEAELRTTTPRHLMFGGEQTQNVR
jgi:hypothetical protein